jgi:hypothetical protein
MLPDTFSESHQLGYAFSPAVQSDTPGHLTLEVVLHAAPTGRHFDPENVRYPIAVGHRLDFLFITHPAGDSDQYRVCAGRVIVRDRIGKQVEAYSLGGELVVETAGAHTLCRLTSSAPILDLTVPNSLSTRLAEEIAILLAERRAAWAQRPAGYDERLTQVDPRQLFAASLIELSRKFSHSSHTADDVIHRLIEFLHSEHCLGPDGWISPWHIHPALSDLL